MGYDLSCVSDARASDQTLCTRALALTIKDFREATAAFAAKRDPVFVGR